MSPTVFTPQATWANQSEVILMHPQSRPAAQGTSRHLAHAKARLGLNKAHQHLSPVPTTIWDVPIPTPPDWDSLDQEEKEAYRFTVLACAVREVADKRHQSIAAYLNDRMHREAA